MEEIACLKRKLCFSQRMNKKLKTDLQAEDREAEGLEDEIHTLQYQLSDLERINEEALQKKDEEIVSLKRSLHAQQEETKREKASAAQIMEASKDKEEMWKAKVSQLEDLLDRANKKHQACTTALVDTQSRLNAAEYALIGVRIICASVEEDLLKQLAHSKENHRRELIEQEQRFRKELPKKQEQFKNEPFMFIESCKRSDQQLRQGKRELEEKTKIWKKKEADLKEEIQLFMEQNFQLQE